MDEIVGRIMACIGTQSRGIPIAHAAYPIMEGQLDPIIPMLSGFNFVEHRKWDSHHSFLRFDPTHFPFVPSPDPALGIKMIDNVWASEVDAAWIKAYVMTILPDLKYEPLRPMFDELEAVMGGGKITVRWPASLILASKA